VVVSFASLVFNVCAWAFTGDRSKPMPLTAIPADFEVPSLSFLEP